LGYGGEAAEAVLADGSVVIEGIREVDIGAINADC